MEGNSRLEVNLHQQWREPAERMQSRSPSPPPAKKMCVINTPLIDLLCRFNGCTSPQSLHRHMRKKQVENLRYLQSLSAMSEAETALTGIGQRPHQIDDDEDLGTTTTPLPKRTLVTTHLKQLQYEVFPAKITHLGADRILALRGYLRVTIRQYFYVRHRINLRYPHLPLVGVVGGRVGGDRGAPHMYYYPLECLQLTEVREEEKEEKKKEEEKKDDDNKENQPPNP